MPEHDGGAAQLTLTLTLTLTPTRYLSAVSCADPCTAFGAGGASCPFESCALFSDAACAWRHCKRAGHLQPSGRPRYALIEGDDQCPSTTQARLS